MHNCWRAWRTRFTPLLKHILQKGAGHDETQVERLHRRDYYRSLRLSSLGARAAVIGSEFAASIL